MPVMDSFDDSSWDVLDYSCFIDHVKSPDLYWANVSDVLQPDVSLTGASLQEECAEKECPRKRVRSDSCNRIGIKACRERLRRKILNDRFIELSSILETGRPPRTDKLAILGDSIRVLNQLKAESQEFKERNEKLLEEIKTLKAEKNELREEKLVSKANKERMEQQLKGMSSSPAGFLPPHPATFLAGANKMAIFPSYGFAPLWQYLPPSALDTSHDQELRSPAA